MLKSKIPEETSSEYYSSYCGVRNFFLTPAVSTAYRYHAIAIMGTFASGGCSTHATDVAHNPGLPSRIPKTMSFEDYEDKQILRILVSQLEKKYGGRMKAEKGPAGLYLCGENIHYTAVFGLSAQQPSTPTSELNTWC